MQKRISECGNSALNIEISPGTYIFAAFLILTVPLKWLLAAWTAALFHELCHIAAIYACCGTICEIRIGTGGAVMETAPMTPGKELLCALSGPAGSILLVVLIRRLPELAICGCIQGIYNLLPFYPLDGGRAVKCLFTFSRVKGEEGFRLFEKILSFILAALILLLFRLTAAAALGCLLCFLLFRIKSSCKPAR